MINKQHMIGIYKITNIKNKPYIGQSITLLKRLEDYKKLNCKTQPRILNSLRKYGSENHKFEIICECEVHELDQLETLYKKFYLNKLGGWNNVLFCQLYDTGGGPKSEATKQKMRKPKPPGFGFGKKHSEEAKIKMSNKRYTEEQKARMRKPRLNFKKGEENGNFGKTRSEEQILYMKQSIIQYDLKGNFIKEWSSIKEANVFLGKEKNASSISLCIIGVYKKAFGFIWKYKDSDNPPKNIKTNFKEIIQLSLKGKKLNEFINPTVAQNKTGINSGAIWFCLKGKSKSAGGFIWKYKE